MSHSPWGECDTYAGQLARTFSLNVNTAAVHLLAALDKCFIFAGCQHFCADDGVESGRQTARISDAFGFWWLGSQQGGAI